MSHRTRRPVNISLAIVLAVAALFCAWLVVELLAPALLNGKR